MLDRGGIEGALVGEGKCSVESARLVKYGAGQRVRLYQQEKGQWAEGEVTGVDETTGAQLVRFDGDDEASEPSASITRASSLT